MKNKWSLNRYIDNTNFKYTKNGKWFLIASGALALIGIIVMAFCGLNLGIDFTGGAIMEIKLGETDITANYDTYIDSIEDILEQHGVSLSNDQKSGSGTDMSIAIRYQLPDGITDSETNDLNDDILLDMQELFGESAVSASETIGPSASSTLLLNAATAILIAVVAILIYIAFRFEFAFGVTSIFALIHDVIIMLSLVAIFQIEVNSSFVAAVITIIGYSINNTIVVFDRVRENRKKSQYVGKDVSVLVDDSVKQTLTRSIYTAITTILAVFLLAVMGVTSLTEFVLPILFGLFAGTYSSIFLAAPMWGWMRKGDVEATITK